MAWFALVPLLAAVADRPPREAALRGWFGGMVCFASTLYWIACIREMSWAGIPACLAFAALLGLYWGLWGWGVARSGATGAVLVAAPLWAGQEWLRGVL